MSIYKVGEVWYIYINHQGRRTRRSTGTADKQAAQEYHDKLKAQLWRKEKLGEDPAATWDDAAKLWLAEPRGKPERYKLKWLTSFLQGQTLASLTTSSLESVLAGKKSNPGNYNSYVRVVLAILNRAHKKGWITQVPRLEKRKVKEERVRWLSAQEWERLQKHLPRYLLQMARFTLATGLREKNVSRLEWSQVDMQRKVAWIHPDQAKARKAIGVPLNTAAMDVLRQQSALHVRWVFPLTDADGPPIRASSRKWYEALKKAKLEGLRWHDLRHTWASWAMQSGVTLPELQRLGGWSSPAMVMRYSHFAPEHLGRAAAKIKPIRRRA